MNDLIALKLKPDRDNFTWLKGWLGKDVYDSLNSVPDEGPGHLNRLNQWVNEAYDRQVVRECAEAADSVVSFKEAWSVVNDVSRVNKCRRTP